MSEHQIVLNVNGTSHTIEVEARTLLCDALRDGVGLLGTHAACEQGVCGSCTVLLDGTSVRSCLMFAVQGQGAELTTIEGVGSVDALHPVQEALSRHHGLQCGFCTAGVVMAGIELLAEHRSLTRHDIEVALSGNLCRCTGYVGIVDALEELAHRHASEGVSS
jgi:carbon-monoxide dehydrogenase small subunit